MLCCVVRGVRGLLLMRRAYDVDDNCITPPRILVLVLGFRFPFTSIQFNFVLFSGKCLVLVSCCVVSSVVCVTSF